MPITHRFFQRHKLLTTHVRNVIRRLSIDSRIGVGCSIFSLTLLTLSLVACGDLDKLPAPATTTTTTNPFGQTISNDSSTNCTLPAEGGATGSDTSAPVGTCMTATWVDANTALVTVAAKDNVAVTAYCIKAETATPSVGDACFQKDNTMRLAVPTIQTFFFWAKDAAGNISPGYFRGICSQEGVAASAKSTLKTACFLTSLGEFVVELEATKAPNSVTNFLKYVKGYFYSQTIFHRVIKDFMVQGGGIATDGTNYVTKTTDTPIALENKTITGLSNLKGTIAFARGPDPNSATSQFFINTVDNFGLDGTTSTTGYAVFGRVISGMDTTIEKIRNLTVTTNQSGETSWPVASPMIYWALQIK